MARNKQGDTSPPPHLLGVLRSLWQWRKPIVFVTIAGTVLAAIISLLLPVYYSASTTFLTISPDQISIDGVFGNTSGRMQFYGTGDDIDRAMSVAESDALVDRLIKKFDLYTVYDIDTTKAKAPLYVRREFMGNYEVKKNARDAIELEIRDQDPIRVAAMVREARNQVNDISLTLVRGTQQRSAQSLRSEITSAEANLTSIDKRIRELRERSGVYNTEAQSEALGAKTTSLQNSIVTTEAKAETMVEEIFGPVLTVYVYEDYEFDEVLQICDESSPYALTGSIFANKEDDIQKAFNHLRFTAGNFYINDKPTGAVVAQQPFGGARASGTNDKAGGPLNLLRWISPRSIKRTIEIPQDWTYPFLDE